MKTSFTFSLFILLSLTVMAQIYHVAPPDYTNTPGNAGFTSQLANSPRTYQLLMHESLLAPLMNKQILAVSWRLPTSATTNWPTADITITDYDFYLGLGVDPASMDRTNFSSNFVGPKKQVRDGSLTILANSYTFGSSPNNWGPEMSFAIDSVWVYNGGNLLIELRQTGFTGTSRSVDALGTSTPGYGTLFRSCWGSGVAADSGAYGNFSIVRITADDPVPVELVSFSATSSGKNVILQWTTATELNNSGFEIQKRTQESGFEVIGFVAGSGSTTEQRSYSFNDVNIPNDKYIYRLKQIDFNGVFDYSNEIEVEVNSPAEFSLEQNYPNPFNPSTIINYSIAEASLVKIAIYNLLGQEVALIVNEFKEAGQHSINFDASGLTSGAYFYTIETPLFRQTKKMLLAK
ncbi:MAG: T9SS type A sorting domain-containing protein [bacterium]|nr:T9SS type A sorting domain-containing protein [bacterium]